MQLSFAAAYDAVSSLDDDENKSLSNDLNFPSSAASSKREVAGIC